MSRSISIEPLSRAAFASFGDVITKEGAAHYPINAGRCERFHDLARVETTGPAARTLINIFSSAPCVLPYSFTLVERHPLGSQAFMPLSSRPFLVIVAPDDAGIPGMPRAFLTAPGEGVNIARNIWHGVLTPLEAQSDFLVVDRGGEGKNLEEFTYAAPWLVVGT